MQLGTDANEANVFRANAAPQGLCDKLDKRADAWRQPVSECCDWPARKKQKRHHKWVQKLHRNRQPQCAGRGHLRKNPRPFKVQKPKFSEDYPEALREGADDLSLQARINIDQIEENRCGPPLVDADWHAF